jgi:hypothetical protein
MSLDFWVPLVKNFTSLDFIHAAANHAKKILALTYMPEITLTRYQDDPRFQKFVSSDETSLVLSVCEAEVFVKELNSEGTWIVITLGRNNESFALGVATVLAMIEQNDTCLFEDGLLGFHKTEVLMADIYAKFQLSEPSNDFERKP